MDLLAAVQTEHHVAALPVGPLDHVVIHQNAVGGQGKAEVLAPLLFHAAGIGYQILHYLEVHQRLAAKEVHFQIASGARVLHEKVQRPLAHLKAHDCPLAVVFSLACKAVRAVQIAGVRDVQAQCLYHAGGLLLELACHGGKGIGGKELACLLQPHHLLIAVLQLIGGDFGVSFAHLLQHCFLAVFFKQPDDVVGYFVHYVHRTGTNVQHDVIAAQLILMNHPVVSFIMKNAAGVGGISV